jgi:MFS family permease
MLQFARFCSNRSEMSSAPASSAAARWAIAAVFFANGAGFASWVSRIPAVRQALSLSDGQLGTALFALGAGALVAFPLAGRGCAVLGARTLTLAASFAYCFVLPQLAMVGVLASLAVSLFVLGAASGAMDVAMNALAAEAEARMGRPIMSSLHGMWSAGGLCGAAFGGAMARMDVPPAWHLGGVALLLALTVLLSRRWLPESPPREAEAKAPRFARPEAAMAGLGGIVFCSFLIEGAMADWSAVFLHDTLGTTAAVAAMGYAAFSLTMMAVRFAGDALVARLGPDRPLRLANLLSASALAVALWSGEAAMALVAFALVGLGVATVAPLVFGAAARRARSGPGHGIAAMATVGYGGFLLGPPCIGWLAQATSLRVALMLLAVLSAVIALLTHHLREPAPAAA